MHTHHVLLDRMTCISRNCVNRLCCVVVQDGVYIKGLYLQGAGWDKKNSVLVEANPMQLVCPMPSIHFKPTEARKKSSKG